MSVDAVACECAGRVSVEKQYASAPIVFMGRVESVRDRWSSFSRLWSHVERWFRVTPSFDDRRYCTDYGMEVTFAVRKAWKGVSSRRQTLVTGRGGGDCGFEFQPGIDYLVYAYPPGQDGCQTNICTRTREAEYAAEDLAYLQRPR